MVFANLLFIFAFLPLNLILYSCFRSIKAKNIVMLVFSLIFYAWGEPVYILLMVGMTFVDWLLTRKIEEFSSTPKKAKLLLFCAVGFDILLLVIFKYGTFFLSNVRHFTGFPSAVPQLALPIGISFYTFQLITYCVDVYRKDVPAQKSYFTLLLYVSMFHQCIAGPIVRYSDISAQLESRKATKADIFEGVKGFTVGLFKKAIIANTCALLVDSFLVTEVTKSSTLASKSVVSVWLGMLMFALQIYFDFSAYSDMAIGMGRMIGFTYPENFNFPYISKSVEEFWRRWHISLGSFFRDYVYIPLGGNRKGFLRTVLNLFIVWALTGLWHGASWNFLLWGLYFFIFIAVEKLFLAKVLKKVPTVGHIYLISVVFFGWILFKFQTIPEILTVVKGLFAKNDNPFCDFETLTVIKNNIIFILFSVIAATPLFKNIYRGIEVKAISSRFAFVVYTVISVVLPIAFLGLSTAALIGNSYNPFLYFRF